MNIDEEEWADKPVEKGCVAIVEDRVRQDIQYTFRKSAEFGFNKANEWHDLRKDSNDLPVLETELLCQKYSGRCFVGYYKDDKFYSHETGKSYNVVRWLDIGVWWNIPQFEE